MYREFFGLQRAPFNLAPDPDFLYLTERHRDALAGITYAILERKGFVVLTGDAGTGKTTLLTRMLAHLPVTRIQSSLIVNPTLTPPEFLESVLLDFGLREIPASKARRIAALQDFLWDGNEQGRISALIVDEAHTLSREVLEEIRLLGNFECGCEKLLQIVLVGQSELDDLLESEHLRQFKQRIALRLAIGPLPAPEVQQYIVHRWRKAGGDDVPFTKDSVAWVANASRGIPRLINVICDNALMEAFGEKSVRVESSHVRGVCRDLRLTVSPTERPAIEPFAPIPAETGAVPTAMRETPMATLERYAAAPAQRSLLSRIADKLGLMQRIETV